MQRSSGLCSDLNLGPAPAAKWLVPFEPGNTLVGRARELAEVESKLFVQGRCGKAAIAGLGGVGKSRLAMEIATRARESRPSCSVFWVQGTDVVSFDRDYLAIGRELKISGIGNDVDNTRMLLKSHLGSEDAGEWLLIIDNADDETIWTARKNPGGESVIPLMDHLPKSRRGAILITTRNHGISEDMAGKNNTKLGDLDTQEALSLIRERLTDPKILDVDPAASVRLVQHLTSLPLALVQAAAFINKSNISRIEDYLQLWTAAESERVGLLSEDFEDEDRYKEAKNPVATTWLISFEHLRKYHRLAADMLAFLACLYFKSIPQSLFPFHLFGTKKINLEMTKAIGALTGYAFLSRRDGNQADPLYDMHRLVHLATRNWLRLSGDKLLKDWSVTAAERIYDVFQSPVDHSNRNTWTLYLPHAEKVCSLLVAQNEKVIIDVLDRVGWCHLRDGKYNLAVDVFRKVVTWREEHLGPDDVHTLVGCRRLGEALEMAGEYHEALNLATRASKGLTAAKGREHSDTLLATSTLAVTYWRLGQLTEAEKFISEVLETQKRELGEQHNETLVTMNNLALVYFGQRLFDKAQELQTQIVEVRKRKLGEKDPETLTAMHNLALTYLHLERWSEAEKLQVIVLETLKEALGDEHPDTLTSMGQLAWMHKNQGNLAAAEELATLHLEKSKKILGNGHPATLTKTHILALILEGAGGQDEALLMMEDAFKARRKKLGEDHHQTLSSMHEFARMLSNIGQKDKAVSLMEECLKLRRSALGDMHFDTLKSMHELAGMLHKDGRREEGLVLMEECLYGTRQTRGEEHSDTLSSMHLLAWMLYEAERCEEGVALMKQCYKLKVKVLGESHSCTLASYSWLEGWGVEMTASHSSSENCPRGDSSEADILESRSNVAQDVALSEQDESHLENTRMSLPLSEAPSVKSTAHEDKSKRVSIRRFGKRKFSVSAEDLTRQ